jgi:excisionase family DNA binding protein
MTHKDAHIAHRSDGSRLFSTRELAHALGVSESSVKRWTDDGMLRSSRTAGGHRRFALEEALRFMRETGTLPERPDVLGLPPFPPAMGLRSRADVEGFRDRLLAGAEADARGLILGLYLAGVPVAQLVDGLVQPALAAIGELWPRDAAGIFLEHRATMICVRALEQLKLGFAPESGAPVALGGAADGDPYMLPSLGAACVLAAEGFATTNLGPQTPIDTLEMAAHDLRPRLIWISASVAADRDALVGRLRDVAGRMAARGTAVVAGGRALSDVRLAGERHLQIASSMAELASFARGLALSRPAPG